MQRNLKKVWGMCLAAWLTLGGFVFAESGILQYVLATIGNTYTYVDTPTVASGRYMPFSTTWTSDGGSNYHFDVDSGAWTGSGIYRSALGSRVPDGGSSPVYQLMSIQGAYIQSPPLQGGVGTIYYTSQMSLASHTGRVLIQVTTNDTPGSDDWETVKIVVYPRVDYIRYQNAEPAVVNRADVRFVRFFRSEASLYDDSPGKLNGAIALDNIAISKPWERITNTGLWGPDFAYPE